MKQQDAEGRDQAPHARGKGPQGGRRALARHHPGSPKAAEQNQRDQGHPAVRAPAEGVEVQDALAAGLDVEEFLAQVALVLAQVADQGDFRGALSVLAWPFMPIVSAGRGFRVQGSGYSGRC